MIQKGDKIVYGSVGVCIVSDITENKVAGQRKKYYVLSPEANPNSTIFVPLDNENLVSRIRNLHSEDELKLLIEVAKRTNLPWIDSTNERGTAYKIIIANGKTEEIITLVRLLVFRKRELEENGQHLSKNDERILKDAVNALSNEFKRVLNADVEKMFEMILD